MSDFGQAAAPNALMSYSQGSLAATSQKAKAAMSAKDVEKAGETAKEFEAVFIAEMIKPMFENLETDGMFGGGKGEEVFRGMLLQEYGKKIAETGSVGLSDSVKQQMILMQEQANNGSQID